MDLSNLTNVPGARHRRKRVGRGGGSGMGKTSTRGHKGQNARKGHKQKLGFEGGQMPLVRRLPKRGFNNARFNAKALGVNLADLEKKFEAGAEITVESLKAAGSEEKTICCSASFAQEEAIIKAKIDAQTSFTIDFI